MGMDMESFGKQDFLLEGGIRSVFLFSRLWV